MNKQRILIIDSGRDSVCLKRQRTLKPSREQVPKLLVHRRQRYRKAEPLGILVFRRIDADHIAEPLDQRSSAVTRVDRRIRLEIAEVMG